MAENINWARNEFHFGYRPLVCQNLWLDRAKANVCSAEPKWQVTGQLINIHRK